MKLNKLDEIEVPLNEYTRYNALEEIITDQIADFAFWNTCTETDHKPLTQLKAQYKEITDLLTWAQGIKNEQIQAAYIDCLETCKEEHESAIYELDMDAYHEQLKRTLPALPFTPKLDTDE